VTLLQQAPFVRYLSRQKFVGPFIIGLIQRRNVPFGEVAQHLNDAVKPASNETRIQDFFRQVNLDYMLVAKLLMSLLPAQGKLRLCLDRTEWDFGQCQVNVLLVTAGAGDVHVPLCGQLLDNRSGNSNAADRIALLADGVALLGRERIELVVGDREFIGHTWLKWLQDHQLPFVVRVPKHHRLTHAAGRRQAVAELGLAAGRPWPSWGWPPGRCAASPACSSTGSGGRLGSRPWQRTNSSSSSLPTASTTSSRFTPGAGPSSSASRA